MRRAQAYPMSVPVGEAILRYLRQARPRSPHRSLFLTVQAPIRPLSGPSITSVVRTLLTKQGVKLTGAPIAFVMPVQANSSMLDSH
jgi:hypothetical protein